jgi:hypothetical protein
MERSEINMTYQYISEHSSERGYPIIFHIQCQPDGVCSCGWSKTAEASDPKGAMLQILKGIHESTFEGHKAVIEGE